MNASSAVRIGGKVIQLKDLLDVVAKMTQAITRGIVAKMEVLAEESREMLIDRLYGASPQPPGVAGVWGPPRYTSHEVAGIESPASRSPFHHVPLAKDTVKRKQAAGLDGRPLIATGDYTYGIEVARVQQGQSVRFVVRPALRAHVGVDPSKPSLPLSVLARIHEYGSASRKIPARPHWRPVIRDIQRRWRQIGRDMSAEALRNSLREIG